jgi:hypothetical protein
MELRGIGGEHDVMPGLFARGALHCIGSARRTRATVQVKGSQFDAAVASMLVAQRCGPGSAIAWIDEVSTRP